jgi:branched-chain amino acid aminotransferase
MRTIAQPDSINVFEVILLTGDARSKDIAGILAEYRLPERIPFGAELAPIMFRADFRDGAWQAGKLVPFGDVPVNPAATALQFAQQAFEGMKAYQTPQGPTLFRPNLNWLRFSRSARRMLMPVVPAALFARALSTMVNALADFIPRGRGQSLYLRPTMFGLDPHFAVHGSDNFAFLLIASPSDAYYADPIRVMIERDNSRAASGGTGAEKVGGNYGASLFANENCVAHDFDQSLWLDPATHTNIEELSAMNFMAVVEGELHTPALSGSLLDGVTRNSLLQIARGQDMRTRERAMPVEELLGDIKSGRCRELFACGTGAIVAPIGVIGEADGVKLELADVNKTASRLREALLDIQEGKTDDTFGWVISAADAARLARFLESSVTR